MNDPSDLEKFVRWYVTPYQSLKQIPCGDGAFSALAIGFLLCERFYKIKFSLPEEDKIIFKNKAAEDMGINMEFFSVFWSTYRNGLMHVGSPMPYERGNPKIKYKWKIDSLFDEYPTYYDDGEFRFICLDPWKFTDLIIQKYLTDPTSITGKVSYGLGKISDEALLRTRVRPLFSQQYPT